MTGALTTPAGAAGAIGTASPGGAAGTVTTPAGGGSVAAGLTGSSNGGAAGGAGNLLSPVTNLLGGLLGGGTKK